MIWLIGNSGLLGQEIELMLKELEEIVEKMNSEDISIDENLTLYKRGKEIVQELVADRMTTSNIIKYLGEILPTGSQRQQMLDEYKTMNQILGDEGASQRAAQKMVNILRRTH